MSRTSPPSEARPQGQPAFRWISAAELAIGAAIVVAANVYRSIPNEVPILFGLGLVSVRLRNGGWAAMGLSRPASWTRVLLVAVAAAVVRIGLGELVVDPLTARLWPPASPPGGIEAIAGNPLEALKWLGIVWTWAAFGEEIGYRGYLVLRGAEAGGRSTAAYWAAIVLAAVLFGVGHYYKGPAGMIDSGFAGLVLGAAYMITGRNLWACILAHGLIDTVGVAALFFGAS